MFKGLSRRKIFYTKCSSGNYFRKQDFVVYLTSLLPPSTFFIFFSEVLIQFMDNAGFLICGVTWKPTLLNHSKKCFFHFLSNFGCGFLRRFWFSSYQIFWILWNLWWAAIYQICKTFVIIVLILILIVVLIVVIIFIKILFFSSTLSLFWYGVL